jgi:hypothetical protein
MTILYIIIIHCNDPNENYLYAAKMSYRNPTGNNRSGDVEPSKNFNGSSPDIVPNSPPARSNSKDSGSSEGKSYEKKYQGIQFLKFDFSVENQMLCKLCMKGFANGQKISKAKCAHIFHSRCIRDNMDSSQAEK